MVFQGSILFIKLFSKLNNEIKTAMLPAGQLGGKYALGKMAEIMMTCNKLIFKIQDEVYKASHEVMAMEGIPAVCTDSTTCFGKQLNPIPEKTSFNRSTSLQTPPELKNVRDPRLRQFYQKLMDLESVGRLEWLKVFMYMSNYMRVLRPVARGEWDKPKKFIQRQTLTLDGPYPGISSDLIVHEDDKPSGVTHFEKIGRKKSADFVPLRSSIKIKNVQLKNVGDDNREFLFKTRPCPRPSRYDPRVLCDCLEVEKKPPETQLVRVPAHHELHPHLYFENKVIRQTYNAKTSINSTKLPLDDPIIIHAKHSHFHSRESDDTVSYYTKDIALNDVPYYFHIGHPFWMTDGEYGQLSSRRGEVFFWSFRLHLARFVSKLPKYTSQELAFHGVKVQSVVVDKVTTFFAPNDYLISGGPKIYNANDKTMIKDRQYRLNHKPYTYTITVHSENAAKGTIRIFLGPKYNVHGEEIDITANWINFMPLNQWQIDLKAGINIFKCSEVPAVWG